MAKKNTVEHYCKYENEIADIGHKINKMEIRETEMASDIKYIITTLKEYNNEAKENTEFRHRATGVIGFVGAVTGVLGGFLVWIMSRIFGDK